MEKELIELTEEEVASLLRIYPTIKWNELSEAGKMMYTILYKKVLSPKAMADYILNGDGSTTNDSPIFKMREEQN